MPRLINRTKCHFSRSLSCQVLLWSSLNWTGSRLREPILWFGSVCCAAAHGYHGFILAKPLQLNEAIMAIVFAQCAVMSVLFNSKLAWASPGSVPAWVQKRVDDSVAATATAAETQSSQTPANSKKRR